jgi:PadR family transcriptional regulator PadR
MEFVVLSVIAKQDAYAADILATLEPTEFRTQEGTLYPLLSKIRRDGAVEYAWQESANGPPRKYYRLTPRGEEQLKELRTHWKQIIKTIGSLSA